MVLNGIIQFKSAVVINDGFLEDIDKLLREYFDRNPQYTTELINGDSIEFESVNELISYDNYSKRAIKTLEVYFGVGNRINIEPTISFLCSYECTIRMRVEVDDSDKLEEIKRKAKLIFNKHKQSTLYTVASKFSTMHIAMMLLCYSVVLNLQILINPQKNTVDMPLYMLIAICTVGFVFWGALSKAIAWAIRNLFPPVVFYLGENIKVFERKTDLKSKIFWGIIVAAFVSAIVSIALK